MFLHRCPEGLAVEVMFEEPLKEVKVSQGLPGMSVVGKRKASVKLLGQKILGTFTHQEGEWWLKQGQG